MKKTEKNKNFYYTLPPSRMNPFLEKKKNKTKTNKID
jgi:hypothetical protein